MKTNLSDEHAAHVLANMEAQQPRKRHGRCRAKYQGERCLKDAEHIGDEQDPHVSTHVNWCEGDEI